MEGGGDFTPPSSRTPLEFTPRSSISFDDFIGGGGGNLSSPASNEEFEVLKHEALRELQQLVNRYNDCFLRLKDVSATNEVLRKENLEIAAENLELAFVIEDLEKENRPPAATGSPSERKRDLLESRGDSGAGSDKSRGGGVPKSISIRSSGFLSVMNPPAGGTHRLRLPASPVLSGGEEEGEVEVDVYNQGTTKTELCNKWGETGWCPYGERCRFAHGVEELRPVIRHPRYKTQLCRMIGSGGDCPYGHRCHFRHALTADRRK